MIIDKTIDLWTPEEQEEYSELQKIVSPEDESVMDDPGWGKRFMAANDRLNELCALIDRRYIDQTDCETAVEDAREIVEALKESDYLKNVERFRQYIPQDIDGYVTNIWGDEPSAEKEFSTRFYRNVTQYCGEGATTFIQNVISLQIKAVKEKAQYDDPVLELNSIISAKVDVWFPGFSEKQRLEGPYTPVPVGYYVLMRDKISSEIVGIGEGGKAVWPINDRGDGRGRALSVSDDDTILFMAWFEDESGKDNLELSHLTWEERDIINAVFSIWNQAREKGIACVMTVSDIYANMPGVSGKPSKTQKELIIRTMTKLSNMKIRIDATDQLKAWGKIDADDDDIKWVRSGRYLELRDNELTIKGRTVTGWRVIAEPIHLEYARTMGHLDSIPRRYLNIKDRDGYPVPMSEHRRMLLTYMLRSVNIIKKDMERATASARNYNRYHSEKKLPVEYRGMNDCISFDVMWDRINSPTIKPKRIREETPTAPKARTRAEEKRDREFIETVLEYWKGCGWIPGYELTKKGTKYTGVRILYQKPKTSA